MAEPGTPLPCPAMFCHAVLRLQSFSAGVGNWVADEVLYQCRIHPEQPAASLGADKVGETWLGGFSCFLAVSPRFSHS